MHNMAGNKRIYPLQCGLCVLQFNIRPKQHTSYYQKGRMLKRPIFSAYTLLLLSSRPLTLSPLRFYFASRTVALPFLADSINEGTINSFLRKEGQWVEMDETVASVETDKVTVQIKSPTAGMITKLHVKEGQNQEVGRPLFDVDPDAPKPKEKEKEEKPPKTQAPKPKDHTPPQSHSEQTMKALSSKQQVRSFPVHQDPKTLPTHEDPKTLPTHEDPRSLPIHEELKSLPQPSHPSDYRVERGETRQAMSRLRKRLGQRLKQSQNTYAMLTTFQEVDMWQAQRTRQQLGEDFLKKYNTKLGYMSFFLKASTLALQEYPVVNSSIQDDEIVRRNFIDISVAVATPTGLLVPVLRDCQKLKLHEFEIGVGQLAKKGKEGKITIQDMKGGTFTISNGGTFGSFMGTPIINPPQSAILGMHSIVNRPVVRGGEIVSRPIMYLALTYDHRLLDGRDAVIFLKRIQGLIQNPKRMLLEV